MHRSLSLPLVLLLPMYILIAFDLCSTFHLQKRLNWFFFKCGGFGVFFSLDLLSGHVHFYDDFDINWTSNVFFLYIGVFFLVEPAHTSITNLQLSLLCFDEHRINFSHNRLPESVMAILLCLAIVSLYWRRDEEKENPSSQSAYQPFSYYYYFGRSVILKAELKNEQKLCFITICVCTTVHKVCNGYIQAG